MSEEDLAILSEEIVEDEPVSEDECIQIKKPVKKKSL